MQLIYFYIFNGFPRFLSSTLYFLHGDGIDLFPAKQLIRRFNEVTKQHHEMR